MRERLIELLLNFENDDTDYCKNCNNSAACCHECANGRMADHLLNNGIVVLPCKAGDTVYVLALDKYCVIGKKRGWMRKIDKRTFNYHILDNYEFGKTVFLTKEEAEAALEKLK